MPQRCPQMFCPGNREEQRSVNITVKGKTGARIVIDCDKWSKCFIYIFQIWEEWEGYKGTELQSGTQLKEYYFFL